MAAQLDGATPASPRRGWLGGRARGRWATLAVGAWLASAPAPARAETRPDYGGQAIGTVLGQPSSLDPVQARSPADAAVVGLLYDTLYRVGPDGAAVPHLAARLPEVAGTAVRIPLRPGVRFHDGSEVTAADVAATLKRVRTSAAGWLLAGVQDIAVDAADVTLTVKTSRVEVATLLALPPTAITPRGADPTQGRLAIGSGPFRLVSARADQLELEANDTHVSGRPYLDRLWLRWFTATTAEARQYELGESHWSMRGATSFSGRPPRLATVDREGPVAVLVYLGFGGAHRAITGQREVRAAIDLALTRRGLDHVGAGEAVTPANDLLPEALGGARLGDEAADARLDAARAALGRAAAVVPALRGGRLAQLSLEIAVEQTRPDDREIAERVVRALDKLGVAATIAAISAPTLARRIAAGSADLYIGHLALPSPNPALWFASAYAINGDVEVARGLMAGGAVDLGRLRAGFAARLPIVPLLHRAIRVHHRAALRGVRFEAALLGLADLYLWTDRVPRP